MIKCYLSGCVGTGLGLCARYHSVLKYGIRGTAKLCVPELEGLNLAVTALFIIICQIPCTMMLTTLGILIQISPEGPLVYSQLLETTFCLNPVDVQGSVEM